MEERFGRTKLLIGEDKLEQLAGCHVAVFGIGGVGGYVTEALARCGIGEFTLIDKDVVSLSNLNRQIIALESTVGRMKTRIMKDRIGEINPEAVVHTCETFFLPENSHTFSFDAYDYVIDAVDTVTAKIELVMQCQEKSVPIISSMGTGNKLDPSKLQISDIYKTSVCPLARVMRRELKQRGIKHLKVVYSTEEPVVNLRTPGSMAFVPGTAGLLIASAVVRDLMEMKTDGIQV
ncbi:MAG: tRNA threonylcarbamoyladenosine dehydratase [Clostridia bacterium]|nr:tRNA threonylcarbamoyladenosine dehydratase [Lachnospiraceae bacterium]NCB99260.1 tRNA threonylcarbamoyladenosine dehydratase [Clostridia bacterium]NCD01409.1 tRNA threonylcarbamoyladenosine dehydratase [Clostridia bacterium]